MAQTFRVEGLRELDAALKELPKATGKNVLRRTLRKVAEPMAADARAKAPDDPATTGYDLRTSIGVGTKLTRRQRSVHRKMFKDDKASVEMFVGAGGLPQAHLREFGSDGHPQHPFMRPAWDAHKRPMLDGIAKTLGDEILTAARRLAKKTARLAAKG